MTDKCLCVKTHFTATSICACQFLIVFCSMLSMLACGALTLITTNIVVTALRQTIQIEPSASTSLRLSTEWLGDVAIPRASLSGGSTRPLLITRLLGR